MEQHEQLDLILKYLYTKVKTNKEAPIISEKTNYNLYDISNEELKQLEDILIEDGFIKIYVGVDGKRHITINDKAVDSNYIDYYTRKHNKQVQDQQWEEQSAANKATIKLGEFAEKAYKLSRRALLVSVGAAIISLIAVFVTIYSKQ